MFIIKVLHIISGNDNGGGGNHVLNICKESDDKFCNILGCLGEGFLLEKVKKLNINKVFFSDKLKNDEIINYVNNNHIDIVDFHGAKPFLIHFFINKALKLPTVATVHSDYRYDFKNNRVKSIFYTPLSIIGLKSFNNYICVSKYIKKLLDSKGFAGEKYIINNGIDVDKVIVCENRSELRENYNINEKDFVFVMVARMHPIKNHKGLIEAFKKLTDSCDNVKLLLVGDGSILEELKKQVEVLGLTEKVIFTGFKSNVSDFINAAEISILTSFNEGGSPPIALLESAALKKTFISTKVGDVEKNFDETECFIVNNNCVEEIYYKMKEAYNLHQDLQSMGEKLFKKVKNKYSILIFKENYFNYYETIISGYNKL